MEVLTCTTADVLHNGLLSQIRDVHRQCFADAILERATDAEFLDLSSFCHEPQDCTWVLLFLSSAGACAAGRCSPPGWLLPHGAAAA
jgi:hypothetical protein